MCAVCKGKRFPPLMMGVCWDTQNLAHDPVLMWYSVESPLGLFLSILSKPMSFLSTKERIRLRIEGSCPGALLFSRMGVEGGKGENHNRVYFNSSMSLELMLIQCFPFWFRFLL